MASVCPTFELKNDLLEGWNIGIPGIISVGNEGIKTGNKAKIELGPIDIGSPIPENLNPAEWAKKGAELTYNLSTDPVKTLKRVGNKFTSIDYWKEEAIKYIPGGEQSVRTLYNQAKHSIQDAFISFDVGFENVDVIESIIRRDFVLTNLGSRNLDTTISTLDNTFVKLIIDFDRMWAKLIKILSELISDNVPVINVPNFMVQGIAASALEDMGIRRYSRRLSVWLVKRIVTTTNKGWDYFPKLRREIYGEYPLVSKNEISALREFLPPITKWSQLGFQDEETYLKAKKWGDSFGQKEVSAELWDSYVKGRQLESKQRGKGLIQSQKTREEGELKFAKERGFYSYKQFLQVKGLGFETKKDWDLARNSGFRNKAEMDSFINRSKRWADVGFKNQEEWLKAQRAGFSSKEAFDEFLNKARSISEEKNKNTIVKLISSVAIVGAAFLALK